MARSRQRIKFDLYSHSLRPFYIRLGCTLDIPSQILRQSCLRISSAVLGGISSAVLGGISSAVLGGTINDPRTKT